MTLAQHLNPLFTRHVSLETALAPTQCAERLRADLAPVQQFWADARQLRGRVGRARFSVHRFRGVNRSLPVEARGRFGQGGAGGRGTRVEVTLGWPRTDAIALVLGLLGGTGGTMATMFAPGAPPAWMPSLFAVIILTVLVLAGMAARGEDDWVLTRISALLDATEVTAIS